jgi:hypothetical protein
MTTRKEIIINKYLEFQTKIKFIDIDIKLFPSLEDYDIIDILIYFNTMFSGTNDFQEYENIIKDLITFQSIDIEPEQLEKAIPIIIQFIDEFKLLQKSF